MKVNDEVKVIAGENKDIVGKIIAVLEENMFVVETLDDKLFKAYSSELEINKTEKEKVLDFIENPEFTSARNRMGCDENWYNPLFAVSHTFPKEEIEEMSEREVANLVKLAKMIGDAFY